MALVQCTLHGNSGVFTGGVYANGPDGCFAEMDRCIVAASTSGNAVDHNSTSGILLTCCDLYGNAGGDWVGVIAPQAGTNGNISEDPLFCGEEWNPLRPYLLHGDSPCAPENNPECGLIGAWGVGCGHPATTGGRSVRQHAFALHGSRPNPFQRQTMIHFELREQAGVSLSVYDLSGRLVRELVDSTWPAGSCHVPWDGLDDLGKPAPPGSYFYRLTSGDIGETGRLLLIR